MGTEVWRSNPAIVFVGNVKEYGAGFSVLPFAKPDDGLLDSASCPAKPVGSGAAGSSQAAVEQHVWYEQTVYLTGKQFGSSPIRSARPTGWRPGGPYAARHPLASDEGAIYRAGHEEVNGLNLKI